MWDSPTLTTMWLAFTIILIRITHKFWPWLRTIAKIPGNEVVPVIGSFDDPFLRKSDIVKTFSECARRHNGLFKMWAGPVPIVIVSDPQYLKTYYTSAHALDRSLFYNVLGEILGGENVFTSSGKEWKDLRKLMMVNFFSSTSVEVLKSNFLYEAEKLVTALRSKAEGPFFPSSSFLMATTARAILSNSVDAKVNEEELSKFLTSCHKLLEMAFTRISSPVKTHKIFYKLFPEYRVFRNYSEVARTFINAIIEKKLYQFLEMTKKAEAIPNLYVFNIFEKLGLNPDTLDYLHTELGTLIVTGLDTTAGTMGFVLTVLGLFPEVQEKVYQEDQELQRRLQGRQLQAEDLQHYRYLDTVIKETLRLFPVGAMIGRQLSADTYFGKYLVPKGTIITALQMYANHNPEIYPEPLKFDPDRFLPENADKIPPYAFNPFSAGPRGCPGMRYANMSMKMMIPAIVREFKIYSKYESLAEALDNVTVEITLKDKQGWPVRLETRA